LAPGELAVQQGERHGPERGGQPADERQAADAGQRGGQQEDAGTDHVPGHDDRREYRAELAVSFHPG
jgi:hypothetical protein